jgi:predicted thioesterase
MLKPGIKGEAAITVTHHTTAKTMKSGSLDVFATPAMIALMEQTCAESVVDYLNNNQTTVGTQINIKHISATPLGATVRCESLLTEVDNRRLVFEVRAYDDAGEIGSGTHERFIVYSETFMEKVNAKLKNH